PSVCGNGVVEPGEACDGTACCTAQCALAPLATVCRPAARACDAADYCDGASATCGADLAQPNGTACGGGATRLGGVCGDLLAWWKLDEASGTHFADSSGNGHDGTLSGAAAFAAGIAGGAATFSGGLGDVPTAPSLDFGTSDFTVAGWLNVPGT